MYARSCVTAPGIVNSRMRYRLATGEDNDTKRRVPPHAPGGSMLIAPFTRRRSLSRSNFRSVKDVFCVCVDYDSMVARQVAL
jgi:hypothetical protein